MISRRQALVGGGTALLSALAGCSSNSGTEGETQNMEQTTLQSLPASLGDGVDTGVSLLRPARMAQFDIPHSFNMGDSEVAPPDIEVTASGIITAEESVGFVSVSTGAVGGEPFRANVESEHNVDLERDGEYEGLERYRATAGEVTFGATDDIAIVASGAELFQAAVETRTGEETPLVETSEDIGHFLNSIEAPEFFAFNMTKTPELASYSKYGRAISLAEENSTYTGVYLYADDQAAQADAAWRRTFSTYENIIDPEVSVDGRRVVVSAKEPTEDATVLGGTTVPGADFEFAYDGGADNLTITLTPPAYPFDAGNIVVLGERAYGHGGNTWADYDVQTNATSPVNVGDSITLGQGLAGGDALEADYRIVLLWAGKDEEDRPIRIGTSSGPDA